MKNKIFIIFITFIFAIIILSNSKVVNAVTNISSCKIDGVVTQIYNGKAKKPTVTITYSNKALKENTDYILSYQNNTNIGIASLTITGKGAYTGTITKNFRILKTENLNTSKNFYILSSLMKTRAVGTENGSTNNATNLVTCTLSGNNSQKFKFVKNSDGSYCIKNSSSGRVIDIYSGATDKNKVNVWLYDSNNSVAQKWYPVKNADGTYTFYTAGGHALDIYAASTKNNANLDIYASNSTNAQKFILKDASTFTPVSIDTNSTYFIGSSIDTNKVIDVYSASKLDSVNIDLYSLNKTNAQKFNFIKNSDSTYSIINVNSNKSIQVVENNSSDGANVMQYTSNNKSSQRWYALKNSDNTITFISSYNGMVLNLNGGKTADLTNVNTLSWNENKSQKWKLKKISNKPVLTYQNLHSKLDDDIQMQNFDLSASGCVFYSLMNSYTKNESSVLLKNTNYNSKPTQMKFYNFGHGSSLDAETITATNNYKYALWTESVGYGSNSNFAISRINYIPNTEYKIAANKVILKSNNKTITINNPDPSKRSDFNLYGNKKNENYLVYSEYYKAYWKGMKLAIDEKNQLALMYHNQKLYIYTLSQLEKLTESTFTIPTESTYYIDGVAYPNAEVTITAKNIAEKNKDGTNKIQPLATIDITQENALSYCWQGIEIDGEYVYLIEGYRANGVSNTDLKNSDGRAFLNSYRLSYKRDAKGNITGATLRNHERVELKEFVPGSKNKSQLEKSLANNNGYFKNNMEVEGLKIVTNKNGERFLYVGITGIHDASNDQYKVGVIKYKLSYEYE